MLASAILLFSALSGSGAAHAAGNSLVPAPTPQALLQVWGTPFDMDEDRVADPAGYGDPEDDLGFKIRRARVGLEGHNDDLRYTLIVGASAPFDAVAPPPSESVQIVDASAGWSPVGGVWIDAGRQKPPIGHEALVSSRHLALSERAVQSEWLVPGRDVGVVGDWRRGTDNRGRLRLGLFDGSESLFGNDDGGILATGRAEFVHGPGDVYRTHESVEGLTIGLGGDGWLDASRATRTVGLGGDLTVRFAGLSVLLEAHLASLTPTGVDVAPPSVLDPTRRLGGLAQVGWALGAWEPAARLSWFDDDLDAQDNGDVAETLVGASWHAATDQVSVGGGYVMRLELAGAAIDNDTVRIWLSLAI